MLQAFGLTKADIPDEIVEVLPDNWDAFLAFDAMSTQWRVGAVGATGLDYNVLPLILESLEIDKRDTISVFSNLRVMESEALKVMAEQRDSK